MVLSLARSPLISCFIGLQILLTPICSLHPQKLATENTSTLEGTIFLLMQSGDTRRGAGLSVSVSRATDALKTESTEICRSLSETRAVLTPQIGAMQAEWSRLDTIIQSMRSKALPFDRKKQNSIDSVARIRDGTSVVSNAKIDSIHTAEDEAKERVSVAELKGLVEATLANVDGQYRVSVPIGVPLIIRAAWNIGSSRYAWRVFTQVDDPKGRQLDLSNANESRQNAGTIMNLSCPGYNPIKE